MPGQFDSMRPPPPGPNSGHRRGSKLRSRKRGSSRKKSKRLTNVSPLAHGRLVKNAGRKNLSSFLSPELFQAGSKSPGSFLTPPPFNLSFGSDLNDEVLMYMDKLDGNPTVCSTPLATPSLSQNSASLLQACDDKAPDKNVSGAPLFDVSNSVDLKEQTHLSTSKSTSHFSFMQTPAKSAKKDHLKLAAWGLPEKVLQQYTKRGITSMFEWQAECLVLPGVLSGGNLVFSAPTSAGKTLVAELLALKCVLETKKKVIIILPFVSIAHEKSNYLQRIFEPVGIQVGGFMGGQAPSGGFAAVDIAICTIEKANSLINHLLEENSTHRLGAVIVDELHMIGDSHRGYLLELLLTKVMYVSRKGKAASCKQDGTETEDGSCNFPKLCSDAGCDDANAADELPPVQLIGMSATLPNLDTLAAWLSAELYHTDFRPVPLKEMVKIGSTLYDTKFQKIRELDKVEGAPEDESDVLSLCQETVAGGHSVLIFCPTKSWCENLATTIAGAHFLREQPNNPPLPPPEGTAGMPTAGKLDHSALHSVCEQLQRTQVGLDQVLERTIPHSVAFHHAGLTFDEREIIEGAFRRGLIKVLVATSTLSAGVNLPARMVIIRTPFFQRSLLDVQVYKQMVGRAGRKGEDSEGESVLICKPSERSKVAGLLKSAPKPVESCLGLTAKMKSTKGSEVSAMKRALLEVVASRTANTVRDIQSYTSCTLLFAEMRRKVGVGVSPGRKKDPGQHTRELIQSTLQFLVENEFIALRTPPLPAAEGKMLPVQTPPGSCLQDDAEYYPTQLGVATVASALSPEEALVVFAELQKARRSFVLENELHIVYLVTPVYIQNQWPRIDWYKYLCLWERLPPNMRHVADTLGVQESFLARAIQGRIPERTAAQRESVRIHQRFFTALALHNLVQEVPMTVVAQRYGASKGLLQSLQGAAGTFAGMVTVFCARLGWKNLELLLSQFQNRLTFGVERELCDLVRISLLNGFRARALYNAGFHTLASLATANPAAIETCLRNAVPFKSRRHKEEHNRPHTTWCAKVKKSMSKQEAALNIIQEAQTILSEELNVPVAVWAKVERPLQSTHQPAIRVSDPPTVSSKPPLSSECEEAGLPLSSLQRGQRKSPSEETNGVHGEIKRPRLQVVPASVVEPNGPREQSMETKPPGLFTAVNLGAAPEDYKEMHPRSVTSNGVMETHFALQTGFVPASTLLRKDLGENNWEKKQNGPQLSDSNMRDQIQCQELQLDEKLMTTNTKEEPPKQSTPASHLHPSPCPNENKHEDSSEDHPLTIPDSIDMSMSFGCQTLAEIDALCANVEREPEGLKQLKVDTDVGKHPAVLKGTDTCTRPLEIEGPHSSSSRQLQVERAAMQTGLVQKEGIDKSTPELEINPALNENHLPQPQLVSNKGKPPTRKEGALMKQPSGEFSATPVSLRDLSSSLHSSQISQSSGVTVIDVTANQQLFETFTSECREQKLVSFSVATRNTSPEEGIGSAIVSRTKEVSGIPLAQRNQQVVGVAFCWGEKDVYYVSLCQEQSSDAIPLSSRVAAVRRIFSESSSREELIAYDLKRHAKALLALFGAVPAGVVKDPCVASWMLDPDAKEKTIHKMVLQYLPEQPTLSEEEDCEDMPLSSLATHATDPQVQASAETVLASLLMSKLQTLLKAQNLYNAFVQTEMPSLLVLAKLEYNGIGFSLDECNSLRDVLEARLLELEREAYLLASRSFSLTSPEDVAQVLFIELKLPSSEEEPGKPHKTLGPHTRRGKKRLQHLSTAKEVLERIRRLHPLPGVILEWRRITSTVTKTIFPLFKDTVAHDEIQSVRIHPTCQVHTATGRIAMVDPSLQMVPKEYDIGNPSHPPHPEAESLLSESQVLEACGGSRVTTAPLPSRPSSICMRNTFIAFPGGVFLAADYSQLELRVLAHVSGDQKLRSFLNQEGDVFKMIAGEWLGIPPGEVSSKQRQEAKQVCYGMVYGIGSKALGKQLDISEDDAAQFIESFKSKYPTMKKFLGKTVQDCRENGYVTTILGRKRFLPAIHSSNIHARSQAERQAVNTKIQGSAADLVNTAMVRVDERLVEAFSTSHLPLAGCIHEPPHGNPALTPPPGAYLVLQLHDELLYEVCERNLGQVAAIVQQEMENALKLSVKFPVKLKVGPSWGRLQDYIQ